MDTSADGFAPDQDDATALATRRLTLRGYADRIAQIVEGLDLPETFLEAERAARAITAADRTIQQLPLTPEESAPDAAPETSPDNPPAARKAPRLRLHAFADRLLTVIGLIPDPDSFLEGERAGRCLLAADRMLSQLYEAPQSQNQTKARKFPRFADDLDDEDDREETSDWRAEFMAKADRLAGAHARNSGIWPDRAAFDKDAPEPKDPWRLADSLTIFQCDSDPLQKDRWAALLMLNRANAVTRAMARRDGRWPDYSPFSENDPDYYSLSADYDEKVLKKPPAKDEDRPRPDHSELANTIGFPWWLVRKVTKEPLPPLPCAGRGCTSPPLTRPYP